MMPFINGRHGSRLAFIAAFLLAFHAWASASALGSLMISSSGSSSTLIVCTASGPRVVTLDANSASDSTSLANPHAGMLPHCCAGGCAMLGVPVLPGLYLLAWTLPRQEIPSYAPAPAVATLPGDLLSISPGRPRGPPLA